MTSTTFFHHYSLHLTAIASAIAFFTLLVTLLSGCTVGPDYVRPQIDTPNAYKENTAWKTATPQQIDANHIRSNTLITQANQNISQAEAQYRQARATADAARTGFCAHN